MKYPTAFLPAALIGAAVLPWPVCSPALAASACSRPGVSSDTDAIAGVLSRYAHYADAKDDSGFAGLFTADGVWEAEGVGRFVGTEALRKFLKGTPVGGRHFTADYVIDIAGNTATARSHVLVVAIEGERPVLRGMGGYQDELICTKGEWKLKSRRFIPAARPPAAK